MKLDEKDCRRIEALNASTERLDKALKTATLARMAAEAVERRAAEAAVVEDRKLGMVLREAALKAGIDPEKPHSIDTASGTIEATEQKEAT